jgi:hypothetical protein
MMNREHVLSVSVHFIATRHIGLINVTPYVYNQSDPMVCLSDVHPTYDAHRRQIMITRRRKSIELSKMSDAYIS